MATMTSGVKPERAASEAFAPLFRAYMEASSEVQEVIRDMCTIMNDASTDADDREAALATLIEALFPISHKGKLGIDIEDLRHQCADECDAHRREDEALDEQERTFSDRLRALLSEKGMRQEDLAERIGVQQPAISMMLNRGCRPQRRTVDKIATALGVRASDLWPDLRD